MAFCAQLQDQLGQDEEVLTERLASAIKGGLQGAAVTLAAVGDSKSKQSAVITVEDRQATKKEEKGHDADLAFLVTISMPKTFLFRSAELVQVRKHACTMEKSAR